MSANMNENQAQDPASQNLRRRVEGVASTNRWLAAAVIVQFVVLAGVGGWLLGRGGASATIPSGGAGGHARCPFELPPRGRALLAGVRCGHGSLVVDSHCEDAHAMSGFVLDLLGQGLDDEQVKAALLRRFGDAALAGRRWASPAGDGTVSRPATAIPGVAETESAALTGPFTPPAAFRMGESVPDIDLERWVQDAGEVGLAGPKDLRSYAGKVVLLDFMYRDCPPCVRALPMLSSLHNRNRARGFAVVSLCTSWGTTGLEALLRRLQADHPVAVITSATEQRLGLKVFPTYVLMDRAGRVRWVGSGTEPPVAELERLLAEEAGEMQVGTKPRTETQIEPRVAPPPIEAGDSALDITGVERTQRKFDPTGGEEVQIRFSLSESAEVTLSVFGPSRELVAKLLEGTPSPEGLNVVSWDGRDVDGRIVPDEAYTFAIQAVSGEKSAYWDPLLDSGGERVVAGDLTTVDDTHFTYQVPTSARVLVRAAVVDGPLLRTIVNWEPRPPGFAVEEWDGMDSDGLRRLSEVENLRFAVMAFGLPDKAIITGGNASLAYAEYYRSVGASRPHAPEYPRTRVEGAHISPHWYIPAYQNRDPGLAMSFVDVHNDVGEQHNEASSPPEAPKPVRVSRTQSPILVRVDIPEPGERMFMSNQKFELILYVDDQRMLEVEQGHVPFTYPWDVSQIEPGRHILTVSVASFRNHVGTTSSLVEVVP